MRASKQSPSRCGTPTIDPVRRTDLLGLCELFLEDKFPPLLLAFPSPSTRQTGNPHVFGGRYFNSLVGILRHKCFFIVSAFLPDQLAVTLSSSPAWMVDMKQMINFIHKQRGHWIEGA